MKQTNIFDFLEEPSNHYETVLVALPDWRPSRDCRTFGVSAIQGIVKIRFLDAVAIKKRLISENKLSKGE